VTVSYLVKRALLGVVVLAVLAGAAWYALNVPYQGFSREVFVELERGAGTPAMARQLADAGVVRSAWLFMLARALDPSVKLQAGEYRFGQAASVREVFARLSHGDIYYFDFTAPEGSNMFDVARLAEAQGVATAEEFLHAAADPSSIRDLSPGARTLEGFLFPSTYRLTHSTTAADLCQMMTREFRRQWARVSNVSASTGVNTAVTIASMVEKETGVAEERALVAGVFVNRLKKPMRLECDPTAIYASLLENRYRGTIHRSDLDSRNPYNTYQNDGLPPGPIANPGAAALEAAVNPAETDYLYFVAKPGGGGHVFSATLAAHQKAVESYRHGPQSKSAPTPPAKPARKAG
jgi:UPF0755 protein